MFDTIIWATDGSEFADSTLPLVTELARTHGSKIVAVHADERFHGGRFSGGPVLADEEEIRAKVSAQVEGLRQTGFEAARLKVEGSSRHTTAELIADAARQLQADVIVVASHGRGGLASAVLGSVAKGLVHLAPCPVLVVPQLHVPAETEAMREVVTV